MTFIWGRTWVWIHVKVVSFTALKTSQSVLLLYYFVHFEIQSKVLPHLHLRCFLNICHLY